MIMSSEFAGSLYSLLRVHEQGLHNLLLQDPDSSSAFSSVFPVPHRAGYPCRPRLGKHKSLVYFLYCEQGVG